MVDENQITIIVEDEAGAKTEAKVEARPVMEPAPVDGEVDRDAISSRIELGQITKQHLLLYLDIFFAKRNGVTFQPVVDQNFNLETLSYMTPSNKADQITDAIVELINTDNIVVVETCSGIGGNTFSFLDSSKIRLVIAHEINPERREMLKRNISQYQFNPNRYIIRSEFLGLDDISELSQLDRTTNPVVLYMDPPWLPSDIPGHISKPDQYLLKGIMIGNRTLEEWLLKERSQVSLVVIRVPLGYVLDPVPGYYYVRQILKTSLVYLCLPIQTNSDQKDTNEPNEQKNSYIDNKSYQKEQKGQSNMQTQYNPQQLPLFQTNPSGWLDGLKVFLLNNMLPLATTSEPVKFKMIEAGPMKIWEAAFTHRSWNPNTSENYEVLEHFGDLVQKTAFAWWLKQKYPDINEGESSKIIDKYLSTDEQARFSTHYGLPEWVRIRVNITPGVREDLFESFFGALFEIAEKYVKPGLGFPLAYNVILNMYNNIPIEFSVKDAKTQVKEIFEKLGWNQSKDIRVPTTEEQLPNMEWRIVLYLTPIAMEQSAQVGINFASPVLGIGTSINKEVADKTAYEVALQTLTNHGVTWAWADQVRTIRNQNTPELGPYYTAAYARMRKDGYVDIVFPKPKKGSKVEYMLLLGEKPDHKYDVLVIVESATNDYHKDSELKAIALDIYGKRGRVAEAVRI